MREVEDKAKSMLEMTWSQFREHRFAMLGLTLIVLFLSFAIGAPMISKIVGIDPEAQNVFNRYAKVFSYSVVADDEKENAIQSFIDEDPARSADIVRFLREQRVRTPSADENTEDAIFGVFEEFSDPDRLKVYGMLDHGGVQSLLALEESFKTFHLLGTDELGRDVFMRLVYGARVSIGVGVMVALASALLGLIIGAVAGVYGGWVDALLMRVTDSLLSLPLLPIMIVFAAVDLGKVPLFKSVVGTENESVIKLFVILCVFSWMTVARLVRGSILSIKEREFVLAAKTLGASRGTIIVTHMIPNVLAPLLVAVTLNVGQSILSEAALSFLGLGIQPPTPSWGNMLFNAQEIIYEAPLLAIFPGILILLVVVSFNFVGDGLQNAVDPKAIKR